VWKAFVDVAASFPGHACGFAGTETQAVLVFCAAALFACVAPYAGIQCVQRAALSSDAQFIYSALPLI
jgi:hypothetical protein